MFSSIWERFKKTILDEDGSLSHSDTNDHHPSVETRLHDDHPLLSLAADTTTRIGSTMLTVQKKIHVNDLSNGNQIQKKRYNHNETTTVVEGTTITYRTVKKNSICPIIDLTKEDSDIGPITPTYPMKNNSALVTNNTSTRKRRYIAKRLGSAMTVGFAPLKRKYSNDHNHNNENSNSHNSQDTDGSERDTKRRTMHPTYDNPMQLMEDDDEELDENMSTTSSSTTTAMSKDIYITRSGRQVRPMVMKEPSSEDLYEEYEYDDGNDNTESIKIKNQALFFCPYRGCDVLDRYHRSSIVAHIRSTHDPKIKTSMRRGGFGYFSSRSGNEISFTKASRNTLEESDTLELRKRDLMMEKILLERTKKKEFVLMAEKMRKDPFEDDDNFIAVKTKHPYPEKQLQLPISINKSSLTPNPKRNKTQNSTAVAELFYCPYKGCHHVTLRKSYNHYAHIRKQHYTDFATMEKRKRHIFVTSSGRKIDFRDMNIRNLLNNGDPIIPVVL